jgi:hypothetical protein
MTWSTCWRHSSSRPVSASPPQRDAGIEGQRCGEQAAPRLVEALPAGSHWSQQVRQRAQWRAALRGRAARAEHRHAAGAFDRVAQQRRLADPGFTPQREHVAAPGARRLEQRVDAGSHAGAPDGRDHAAELHVL